MPDIEFLESVVLREEQLSTPFCHTLRLFILRPLAPCLEFGVGFALHRHCRHQSARFGWNDRRTGRMRSLRARDIGFFGPDYANRCVNIKANAVNDFRFYITTCTRDLLYSGVFAFCSQILALSQLPLRRHRRERSFLRNTDIFGQRQLATIGVTSIHGETCLKCRNPSLEANKV